VSPRAERGVWIPGGGFCNEIFLLDFPTHVPDSSPAALRREKNDNDVALLYTAERDEQVSRITSTATLFSQMYARRC